MAQTTPPSMTPAPSPAPQRNDRVTFSARVDAFVTWITNAIAEFSALATNVYNNAVDAYNSSTAAATQASNAQTQANAAAASAAAAVVTASASAWVNGGTYALNANAISQIDFLTYRKQTTSSVTTIDPKNDSANWVPLISSSKVSRSARTSNTILTAADKGSLIDITSGTFTQTFTAAATLGDGWFCYLKNSGTGDITLDPNASELIDGLTSYVMYPGESRLVQCDGTKFTSIVLTSYYRTFTASGTFVTPPGYSVNSGLLWGGGASGGAGGTGGTGGSGGGGGVCVPFSLTSAALGVSQTVTIGAGGAAVSGSSPTAGNAGGNSSIGSLVNAYGGGGGFGGAGTSFSGGSGAGVSGAGVVGSTGNALGGAPAISSQADNTGFGGGGSLAGNAGGLSVYGGGGGGGATSGFAASSGGSSFYGGGGGGATSNTGSNAGGASVFGGAGGAGGTLSTTNNGSAGVAPGGGGGGTRSTGTSGAGARGELRIWGVV